MTGPEANDSMLPCNPAAGDTASVPAERAARADADASSAAAAPGACGAAPSALWFPELPSKPARLLPPLALAYIGDAVYEVAVRQHVMARPNLRPHHLHRLSTNYVSAKAQSRLLTLLEPRLSDDEIDIVRRGRNAKSGTIPKNADVLEYRHATAFECLVGFLYYAGSHERLRSLIAEGFERLDCEQN